MGDNVIDINAKTNNAQEAQKDKMPTNKEIVDAMLGEFRDWVKASYGFDISYQEMRQIAVNLFWQEYVYQINQAIHESQKKDAPTSREIQAEELDKYVDQINQTVNEAMAKDAEEASTPVSKESQTDELDN